MRHDLVLWFFFYDIYCYNTCSSTCLWACEQSVWLQFLRSLRNLSMNSEMGTLTWRYAAYHLVELSASHSLTHTHTLPELNPSILCPRSGPLAPVSMHSHWLGCAAADTANRNASRESDWYVVRSVRNALIFFRVASDYSWEGKKTKQKNNKV